MAGLGMTSQAVNILYAASRTPDGVRVRDLVAATVRFTGRSLNAARSRVTGTSRALWRAGLVELHARCIHLGTMTDRQHVARDIAQRAAANPETFYHGAVNFRGNDPYGSAAACVVAKHRDAARLPRLYVDRITITAEGRARLARLLGGTT
jgi:hypothetical protein